MFWLSSVSSCKGVGKLYLYIKVYARLPYQINYNRMFTHSLYIYNK